MGTAIVLVVLCVIVFFIARSEIRKLKSGQCTGSCAGCSGSCASCGGCSTKQTKKTKRERV